MADRESLCGNGNGNGSADHDHGLGAMVRLYKQCSLDHQISSLTFQTSGGALSTVCLSVCLSVCCFGIAHFILSSAASLHKHTQPENMPEGSFISSHARIICCCCSVCVWLSERRCVLGCFCELVCACCAAAVARCGHAPRCSSSDTRTFLIPRALIPFFRLIDSHLSEMLECLFVCCAF